MDLDKVKKILEKDYGYSNLKEGNEYSWFINSILKDTIEIVKLNYTPSYLQLKDKETKVFEDWALKQGYYVEKYKWFDIAGEGINYYTIVNRYKRKFKL